MLKHRWILAAVWLMLDGIGTPLGAASGHFTVDRFGAAEGLPASVVFSLLQTHDGYLWAGTQHGLARFDGAHFTVYDENNTPGLGSSEVNCLFEDSQGNLWIGTRSGGTVRVDDAGMLTSLDNVPVQPKSPVVAACEDRGGDVWLYHANGLLDRCRQGKWVASGRVGLTEASNFRAVVADESGRLLVGTSFTLDSLELSSPGTQNSIPPSLQPIAGRIHYLLAGKGGGFWLLADAGIQRYKSGRLANNWGPYSWLTNGTVLCACEDRDGNLVVGTYNDGLYWLDSQGRATRLGIGDGLSHDTVMSMLVDRDGCLWVGTDGGGLNRVKRKVFDTLEFTRGAAVQSLCADGSGLWIGCNSNRLDFWSNGVSRRFQLPLSSVLDPRIESPPDVKSVFVSPNAGALPGSVLVGVSCGRGPRLFQLDHDQFKPIPLPPFMNQNVAAIFQDKSGQLWLGTEGGLLRYNDLTFFTATNGLSANNVRAVAETAQGTLWIGTQGGGLNRLSNGQFTVFNRANGLPSDNVTSLHVDTDGILWAGTEGGLARFKNGQWTRFSRKDGLAANSIAYVVEDAQGYLWLGSNLGIMRVSKQSLSAFADGLAASIPCRTFGEPDGLPSGECTFGSQPSALCAADGTLWLPTTEGLAYLNPARLSANSNPPPVLIESVSIDGQLQPTNSVSLRVPALQSITVPPGKEDLEIRYASLDLSAPGKGWFKYRLSHEGRTNVWSSDANNGRVVHYNKLRPGQYHFQVVACNEDEVWNQTGASMAITVLPAFWQTWWFLGVSILTLLGLIVGGVHYVSTQNLQRQVERLRHQEALEKERARIARDIHDQVGASLTQVSLLGEMVESDKDNPKEIEEHGRTISQTARETAHALDEIVWTVNPSNDTLEGLVNYVCKHAQEYLAVAGLRYRIDVPPQLPVTPVSPELRHNVFLAAKEAITNIVKHAHATSVWVRLNLEPGRFVLEIEDNGRGLTGMEGKTTRNGLRNMRKRMEDVRGQFDIGPGSEGGTKVTLTAPMGM